MITCVYNFWLGFFCLTAFQNLKSSGLCFKLLLFLTKKYPVKMTYQTIIFWLQRQCTLILRTFVLITWPEKFTALRYIFSPLHWHQETQPATYHTIYVDLCSFWVYLHSSWFLCLTLSIYCKSDCELNGIKLALKQSTNICLILTTSL